MDKIIGKKEEIQLLEDALKAKRAGLIAVYGRPLKQFLHQYPLEPNTANLILPGDIVPFIEMNTIHPCRLWRLFAILIT